MLIMLRLMVMRFIVRRQKPEAEHRERTYGTHLNWELLL